MRSEKRGPLEVRLAGGEGAGGPMIVLLHGFGAPGDDLVPLWRAVDADASVRWAFPAAPLELPSLGFGMESRAWWHIDMLALQQAMMRGERVDMAAEVPIGLSDAREAVIATLDALDAAYGPRSIVLGGFSQGAMLALDVALHASERKLAGLVLMSSTLLAEREWAPRMAARAGLPVVMSHGTHDPLLPYPAAETLRDKLRSAGLDVDWIGFRGGHEIGPVVLDRVSAFLRRVL